MDKATQGVLTARIKDLLRRRSTDLAATTYRVPAADYTSPAVLALELDRLFLHGPLLAGLSGDARAPGDWFTFDACGRSVVVWRAPDGTLRAFVNACRHRGMQVACGRGRSPRVLVCPFHAWSYDADGNLASMPGAEGFSDVAREELRLATVPVREEAGVIYVGLTPAEWGTTGLLSGADAELVPFGLAQYHQVERREHRFESNWKLAVDSFMEAYHLHFLHKDTLRPLFHGNLSAFDAFGRNGRIVGVRRTFDSLMTGEGADAGDDADASLLPHVTLLYQLFPNAVLIYQQDHIELYQQFPDVRDPDVCHVRVTLYAPQPPETDGERAYWKRNLDLIDGVTTTEDFAACEKIQANLRSGAAPGLILGRNEPGVAHFHRMLHRMLGG